VKLRHSTIRGQMLAAIGAVVLLVMALLVTATLSVAHRQLYELAERDLRNHVESIAARARFAAIVGVDSPEVAKQLLHESTGTNGIEGSELVSANGNRIAALDSTSPTLATCRFVSESSNAEPTTVVTRVGAHWCVSSPILEHAQSGACSTAHCLIGHLHVVASTEAADTIVRRLLETILILGGALLLVAFAILWQVSASISRPLRDIAAIMGRFAAGDRSARAIESGPEEMMTISHVYNDLIDVQEAHARTLETRVEERTRQLKEATLAAQDAERYKTTFMAHVSHDMRTPLHVIRAHASEVMNEFEFGGDLTRARAPLDVILRECDELSFRVSQVLELMRGEAGHAEVNATTVSIDNLRASVFDKAQALARQNRNRLLIESGSGALYTDGDKVLHIISNLVDNACKFTRDGSVTIALQLLESEFHVTVTDSGIGIPAGLLPHIWSAFRQVPTPDGRRIGGFGLGLAIVRHYITLLGGRYGADSVEGQGTTVWVILPTVTAPPPSLGLKSGVDEPTTIPE
jgi:signal transduction histidine kinase